MLMPSQGSAAGRQRHFASLPGMKIPGVTTNRGSVDATVPTPGPSYKNNAAEEEGQMRKERLIIIEPTLAFHI